MRATHRLVTALTATIVAAIAISCGTTATANAVPLPAVQNSTTQTSLPVASTLTAHMGNSSTSTTVTLPSGMIAASVSGTLTVASSYTGATVSLLGGTQTLTTVDASANGESTISGSIPASATTTADGLTQVTIGLAYTSTVYTSDDQGCWSLPTDLTVTLTDISIALTGTAQLPATIGQFTRGPAQQIIIVSGSQTSDQRVAALAAAASAARIWSDTDATIDIQSTQPSGLTPTYPGAIRIITIASQEGTTQQSVTTTDGIPTLTLTGAGDDLIASAQALGDDRLVTATSDTTTGLSASPSAETVTSATLADLGLSTARLSGPGYSEIYLGVPQTRFGGPVSSFDIHLVGTHSALPDQIVATANVYWNDDLVDSFTLGSDIAVDRSITIASTQMQASNSLRIVLSTAAISSGVCGIPVELDLDTSASTVDATRGQSLDAGFQRFPQTLGSAVDVAFDSGLSSDTALALAGQIIVALQEQQTFSPLVVDEKDVADISASSSPAIVIGATSDTANTLKSPLRLDQFRAIDDDTTPIGVGVDQAYFSLQAFSSGNRDILLAGGWTPDGNSATLDPLATRIGTALTDAEYGWLSWSDNLILTGGGDDQSVINLSSASIVPQASAVADYNIYAWYAGGALLLLLLIIIVSLIIKRVRRRKTIAAYVEEEVPGSSAK